MRDSCGGSGTGETHRRMRRGGSAHAPRKASILKRKSTTPKSNKGYENSLIKRKSSLCPGCSRWFGYYAYIFSSVIFF
ncbi:hypothetical protein LCY76_12415 [Fictibacillus sp. KIGAM418]|uniref:Uncharacterized protein n=1 Tax=Fictibacillus marinisediminis TaxID=2878389 RepID=A0A9X2BD85_9BACL|nr:hypothetical protein [Fictibacillus marinisediminis]MCK6257396.1 hypothetical protein [Fictibacillus marinisediminis]